MVECCAVEFLNDNMLQGRFYLKYMFHLILYIYIYIYMCVCVCVCVCVCDPHSFQTRPGSRLGFRVLVKKKSMGCNRVFDRVFRVTSGFFFNPTRFQPRVGWVSGSAGFALPPRTHTLGPAPALGVGAIQQIRFPMAIFHTIITSHDLSRAATLDCLGMRSNSCF